MNLVTCCPALAAIHRSLAILLLAVAAVAADPPRRVADRAACSSLVAAKQPLDAACQQIRSLGFRWVDLSCLSWAPHVAVTNLVRNFDAEEERVRTTLKAHGLKIANFTFDAPDSRPFDAYRRDFSAVARLAVRLHVPLINVMAPSATADRAKAAEQLRHLQSLASLGGVTLTVETHVGQLTEQPADALWLCAQVPGLKLTLDPSHYFAGPNQGANFDALMPLVAGTGFRAGAYNWDSIQLPWGEGPIDFGEIVGKLEAAGYRGFYVAEYIEGFNAVNAATEARRFRHWTRELRPR